jgi:hypothetical protein
VARRLLSECPSDKTDAPAVQVWTLATPTPVGSEPAVLIIVGH